MFEDLLSSLGSTIDEAIDWVSESYDDLVSSSKPTLPPALQEQLATLYRAARDGDEAAQRELERLLLS